MSCTDTWSGARIYTVGHSTRTLDEFVDALRSFGVRRWWTSGRCRGRGASRSSTGTRSPRASAAGLRYEHLGGAWRLAEPRADSTNTAWRNASFRGYADYMQTPEFDAAVRALRRVAEPKGRWQSCAPRPCRGAVTGRSSRTRSRSAVPASSTSAGPDVRAHTAMHLVRQGGGRARHLPRRRARLQPTRHEGAISSRSDRARIAAQADEPGRCLGARPLPAGVPVANGLVLVEVENRGTNRPS